MAILFSLFPIALLGHNIESLGAVAAFLLVSFCIGYRDHQSLQQVVVAFLVCSAIIILGILETAGFTPPFIITILLAAFLYIVSTPRTAVTQRFLVVLNLIVISYTLAFSLLNPDLAIGERTIGGFSENSFVGQFAFNFGFGSPARAAVILFALFVINLKNSRSRGRKLVLTTYFILIILTLNRLTLFFVVFAVAIQLIPLKNLKFSMFAYIAVGLSLICLSLALPDFIPLIERLERIASITTFTQNNASFDYIKFIESGQASSAVERSADMVLTISALNLGSLGVFVYIVGAIATWFWSRNNANRLMITYFLVITFKNFSFCYDISSITLILIAKLTVLPHAPNDSKKLYIKRQQDIGNT